MVLPGKVMFISVHGDPLATLGSIQSGGQNVYVRELILALESRGMRIDVFTHWSNPKSPQVEPLGRYSRIIRLPAGCKGFLSKHQMFGILPAFTKELNKYLGNLCQYNIIHSNYWLSGWVGLQFQKKHCIPRVHTSHSLGTVRKGALDTSGNESLGVRLCIERELLREADRVIATTPLERDILTDSYSVLPENISVVPCGVNIELFHPIHKKHTKGRKIILFVGRFEENKGLEILLKSLAILKEKYPSTAAGYCLVIAGGDRLELPPESLSSEKKKFLEFIRENGISDMVTFAGPVKHKDLPAYYTDASITVVPSYYESFGLVAVEAMACGCPVIASRTGGLQHNVLDGKTGLLVEPKNPEKLTSAINYLLTNGRVRKQMSREAALHGRKFSWHKIAYDMVNIYKEVTGWKRMYSVKKAQSTS